MHTIKYKYDSVGLFNYKYYSNDYGQPYDINYKYYPLSNGRGFLTRYWKKYRGENRDTSYYKFDSIGNITESLDYEHEDYSDNELFITFFKYDISGKLIQKSVFDIVPWKYLKKVKDRKFK